MSKEKDIQKFIDDYKDKDGQNPFKAGLSLFTFVKRIPVQIFKGIGLAILVYIVLLAVLFLLGVKWYLIFPFMIGGFFVSLFVAFTATIRFVSVAFLEDATELLLGLLNPLDEVYDLWLERSDNNLSRSEFVSYVMKDSLAPGIIDTLASGFFTKRLKGPLNNLTTNILGVREEKKIELEERETFIDNMMDVVKKASGISRKNIGKPFRLGMILLLLGWGVVLLVHLAF